MNIYRSRFEVYRFLLMYIGFFFFLPRVFIYRVVNDQRDMGAQTDG